MKFSVIAISYILIIYFGNLNIAKAQSSFPKEIKKAFISGNSKKLAHYFDRNIELQLIDKGDVYSKAQAEIIIKNFFINNSPKSFIIESENKDEISNFAIALLKTKKKDFRVFIAYKKTYKKLIVNQMVISEVQ